MVGRYTQIVGKYVEPEGDGEVYYIGSYLKWGGIYSYRESLRGGEV